MFRYLSSLKSALLPQRLVLFFLLTSMLLVLYASGGYAAVSSGVCPEYSRTQKFLFAYGSVTMNGEPAPIGTIVEARSPRDNTVGCTVAETIGVYSLMYIYGEETVGDTVIAGMRLNEKVAFFVNGQAATTTTDLSWSNDWNSYQIDVNVVSTNQPVSIPLYSGWNLVSIPLQPEDTAVEQVFSSVAGNLQLAYAYRACDQLDSWKKFDPGAPSFVNDLQHVDETMGLWMKVGSASGLTLVGLPRSGSAEISLCPGWNLVSFPGLQAQSITEAVASITNCLEIIYSFESDDTADPWKKYDPNAPIFVSDLTQMKPGLGYWMNANQSCVWTIPN